MRKILFGVVLVALLTLIIATPALADGAPLRCPPNEVALMKVLKQRGIIPRDASQADATEITRAYVRDVLGGVPEDRPNWGNGALDQKPRGNRTPWGRTIARTPGPFIDNALVILAQFSTASYSDAGHPEWGTFPGGPTHGLIPAPKAGDNSTFWPGPGEKGFGAAHYQKMLFGTSYPVYDAAGKLRGTSSDTMRNYFLQMSKGQYTVGGDIATWVTLPYPEAYYGRNDVSGDDLTGPAWRVARDAVIALDTAQPSFDWAKYDTQDPFDIDGDTNYSEPDGYVDHLIIIHAGVDESAGGGSEGEDALWAHSWWIDSASGDGPGAAGGYQVPGTVDAAHPQGIWAGPYTLDPEDGANGVFCHEFAHDLGLPDEYDTSYMGESPSGFWTLMASGSWLGKKWGLGSKAGPMNAWDKVALGFISAKTIDVGATATVKLAPAATGTAGKVAFKVMLPPANHSLELSGADDPANPEWYSGSGDNIQPTLTTKTTVAVPNDPSAALTFDTWFEIEDGYDYGFVEVSTDGGTTWTVLDGSDTVATGSDPGDPQGLSGTSGGGVAGADAPVWAATSYSLAAFAGQDVTLRFRYKTDGGVSYRGWEIDNLALGTFSDDATADPAQFDAPLDAAGVQWTTVDGGISAFTTRYYMAEYRTQAGADAALKACYNFNDYDQTNVDWFPYNTGLHLIYRDTWWTDNNVGQHPGEGGWMVVDAHPYPDYRSGYDDWYGIPVLWPWRSRIQTRDAAFSTLPTKAIWLTPYLGTPEKLLLAGRRPQPVFDDGRDFWYPMAWDSGTWVPTLGVKITVKGTDRAGNLIVNVKGADELPPT